MSLLKLYNQKFHDRPGQFNSHDFFLNQGLDKPLEPPDVNRDQIKYCGYRWVPGTSQKKIGYQWVPGTSHKKFFGYRWVPATGRMKNCGY